MKNRKILGLGSIVVYLLAAGLVQNAIAAESVWSFSRAQEDWGQACTLSSGTEQPLVFVQQNPEGHFDVYVDVRISPRSYKATWQVDDLPKRRFTAEYDEYFGNFLLRSSGDHAELSLIHELADGKELIIQIDGGNRIRIKLDSSNLSATEFIKCLQAPMILEHSKKGKNSDYTTLSQVLMYRISCIENFSVFDTFELLLDNGHIGDLVGGTDNTTCFRNKKALDLLGNSSAPVDFFCFSDARLDEKYPDRFSSIGPRYEEFTIGFVDRGNAIEEIKQDPDGNPGYPRGFEATYDLGLFTANPKSIRFADTEWSCFPPD